MFKLILICALVASALADVSHIYKPKINYRQPIKRVTPVQPAPVPVQRTSGNVRVGTSGPAIAILRNDLQLAADGSYQYSYETQNGISASEQASIRPTGPEQAQKNAQGSFSFTSPEGAQFSVSYIADENGYQPVGAHLPTPPPIPIEIQRALEWIASHPPQSENKPGLRRY